MKKIILFGLGMLSVLTSAAAFKYLEFKTTDGRIYEIEADGLVLTFDDGNISAVNSSQNSLNLSASEIQNMQFTDVMSGVDAIQNFDASEIRVFDLAGIEKGRFSSMREAKEALDPGIYMIINKDGETIKTILGK